MEGFSVCRAKAQLSGPKSESVTPGLSFKAVEKLSHLTRAMIVIQLLRQRIDEGNYFTLADSACVIKFSH